MPSRQAVPRATGCRWRGSGCRAGRSSHSASDRRRRAASARRGPESAATAREGRMAWRGSTACRALEPCRLASCRHRGPARTRCRRRPGDPRATARSVSRERALQEPALRPARFVGGGRVSRRPLRAGRSPDSGCRRRRRCPRPRSPGGRSWRGEGRARARPRLRRAAPRPLRRRAGAPCAGRGPGAPLRRVRPERRWAGSTWSAARVGRRDAGTQRAVRPGSRIRDPSPASCPDPIRRCAPAGACASRYPNARPHSESPRPVRTLR